VERRSQCKTSRVLAVYITSLSFGSRARLPLLAETAFLLGRNGPQQQCIVSSVRRVLGRFWIPILSVPTAAKR